MNCCLKRQRKHILEDGKGVGMKLFAQLLSYFDDWVCDDAVTWLKQQRDKEEEDLSQDIETFTVKGVEFNMIGFRAVRS